MLVPLYGFLKNDSIGLLVLVHDNEPVSEIGRKLQQAAAVRVKPKMFADVIYRGTVLNPEATIAGAGLSALERVDVIPRDE